MTTQFTWKITDMYTINTPEPDFVCMVRWSYVGVDAPYVASISNVSKFQKQIGTFTPYEDLTKEQVIGWIQEELGPVTIGNMQSSINGAIETQKNPPQAPQPQPLPW
jgi:hypothetical protein